MDNPIGVLLGLGLFAALHVQMIRHPERFPREGYIGWYVRGVQAVWRGITALFEYLLWLRVNRL